MLNFFGNKSGFGARSDGGYSEALQAIDSLYQRELQANMAALSEQRRKARLKTSAKNWSEYWPFAVGIVLSCFVPQLRDLIDPLRPWEMWMVFPFASIAGRPEVALASQAAAYVPLLFMYIQFPLEGLMARFALRGQVTVARVLGQVVFLHLFAMTELWLVNSPWGR
jgi:hypothetical protein